MSLLTVVTKFTQRTALPVPVTIVGNTDPQVRQILTLLEEECSDLGSRYAWSGLTKECTFLALAAESQGLMSALGSGATTTPGFRYVLNNVLWNRTTKLRIDGPLDVQDWQALKAQTITGLPQYRIRENTMFVTPAPTAGNTISFEYVTENFATSAGVGTNVFLSDADLILLPEPLVTMGLRWRFKKEKGLTYGEDFNSYERMVSDAIGRDGTKKTLNMSSETEDARPRIFVPPGSWAL